MVFAGFLKIIALAWGFSTIFLPKENHVSSDVNAEILTREVEEQIENSKNW